MRYQGMKSHFIKLLAASFTLFIFWIIYTADTGGTIIFTRMIKFLPYPDKWGHFMLFGVLSLLINMALQYQRISVFNKRIYLGTLLVSVFAFLEELSQGFLATRSLDHLDLLADAFGILLFTYIARRVETLTRMKGAIK